MSRNDPERDGGDTFTSVEDGPETEIKVKASRFIARVFAVDDEAHAARCVTATRRRYHDARHHCWALRLPWPEAPLERSDDDGEPSGTAGPPILGALVQADVYGACVIVTRYFGGTKLGTGGLIRAYGGAAREALEKTPRRCVWREIHVEVRCDYGDVGHVESVLARHEADLRGVERDFGDRPTFRLRCPKSRAAGVMEALTEGTAGRARLTREDPS